MSIRLKNTTSGVTVEVADEKVERLGSGWRPVGEEPDVEPVEPEAAPVEPVEPKRAPGRPKKAPTPSE